ncbi:transketolase [Terasakiispira papahanaumokuakeensis]|uniref:transketolase n=1 Tax=Terasakiispira papahanaumokuakeensis TaxID=197479 RepID=UPI000A0748CB|nr:transketolase [Terasakiispira papahanaumokuakeensis]
MSTHHLQQDLQSLPQDLQPQRQNLQPLAHAIRFLSIDAIVKAQEGHQGVPLGMAEIATVLFTQHLKFHAADPEWPDRDRVVLSNGHGSMLLYSLLYLTGYEAISLAQIKTFRELGSRCAGHPERSVDAGIEVTTGPLGQGIGNALGMAVAEASLRAQLGEHLVNHHTYAFVGDGCLQEGMGQEMISLAGHLQLGRLILFWDDNHMTDDGDTHLAVSEDVCGRFRMADWHVVEIDGHDLEAISTAILEAKQDPRPSMIACRTVIGYGVPRVQGTRGGHSARLTPEDAAAARQQLGWPYPAFETPEPILNQWRAAGRRHESFYHDWHQQLAALPRQEQDEFQRRISGALPPELGQWLDEYKQQVIEKGDACPGIMASSEIHARLTPIWHERLIACADLEAPTAHKRLLQAFTAEQRTGTYIHCGIREHVMGAMANGIAAHGGAMPLSVTYLAFSDYQRGAMRMSALMKLPVKYVFSHDSIGVGSNGPTHQPVEILASLRAMPNMYVFRPADAVEAAECWQAALEYITGPSTLAFAKQSLPLVRTQAQPGENCSKRGAYILAEASVGTRAVTLLATGSEVSIALEAREQLQSQGIPTAVISMPCWELFECQTDAYKREVLGSNTVRIGVEAALRFGWDRYLEGGDFVGMTGFGDSGSAEALYQHFNITPEAVVAAAKRRLSLV